MTSHPNEPPKWYASLVLLVLGLFAVGVYCLFTSNSSIGITFILIALVAFISMYFFRKKDLTDKPAVNRQFSKCKKCNQEPSKSGNYTNMLLANIPNPVDFDNRYGIMCKEHAAELTEQIMAEKNLDQKDWDKAMSKATKQIEKETRNI